MMMTQMMGVDVARARARAGERRARPAARQGTRVAGGGVRRRRRVFGRQAIEIAREIAGRYAEVL